MCGQVPSHQSTNGLGVDRPELLKSLTIVDSIPVAGESMVFAGIRLDPLTGKHHPAVLVRCEGNDDLHVLALPDTDALKHFVHGFCALAQDAFEEALGHFRTGLACNPSNAPLCADIVQLMEAVERLQRREAPPADADAQHVLLSGYARGLH